MKAVRRYLVGLLIAAGLGVVVLVLLPSGVRPAVTVAMILGFFVQAPLGWLLTRAYGKAHFLQVWGVGIALRMLTVGVLAVAGLKMGVPRIEALLVGLVATLFCLLMVEAGALLGGEAE